MFSGRGEYLNTYLPVVLGGFACLLLLWTAHYFLIRRRAGSYRLLVRQLVMLALTLLSVVVMILVLPVASSTRDQLLALLGLVVTGVFALSSTTFVSNAMAGFMLRAVKSFKGGDFVRVGSHFGRVTERGLFHTEIQSQDRDLITLPNLYLVNQAVTVIRSTGTVTSCELSLGYDVPWHRVEPLLKAAASDAGLQDPFVQILALGDYSIQYKVAGFLAEVTQLLSRRTSLHRAVLDRLHEANIEIVSPRFINQRQLGSDASFVAAPQPAVAAGNDASHPPEVRIFDKAERAHKVQALGDEIEQLAAGIEMDKAAQSEASAEAAALIDGRIREAEQRVKVLQNIVDKAREKRD